MLTTLTELNVLEFMYLDDLEISFFDEDDIAVNPTVVPKYHKGEEFFIVGYVKILSANKFYYILRNTTNGLQPDRVDLNAEIQEENIWAPINEILQINAATTLDYLSRYLEVEMHENHAVVKPQTPNGYVFELLLDTKNGLLSEQFHRFVKEYDSQKIVETGDFLIISVDVDEVIDSFQHYHHHLFAISQGLFTYILDKAFPIGTRKGALQYTTNCSLEMGLSKKELPITTHPRSPKTFIPLDVLEFLAPGDYECIKLAERFNSRSKDVNYFSNPSICGWIRHKEKQELHYLYSLQNSGELLGFYYDEKIEGEDLIIQTKHLCDLDPIYCYRPTPTEDDFSGIANEEFLEIVNFAVEETAVGIKLKCGYSEHFIGFHSDVFLEDDLIFEMELFNNKGEYAAQFYHGFKQYKSSHSPEEKVLDHLVESLEDLLNYNYKIRKEADEREKAFLEYSEMDFYHEASYEDLFDNRN